MLLSLTASDAVHVDPKGNGGAKPGKGRVEDKDASLYDYDLP